MNSSAYVRVPALTLALAVSWAARADVPPAARPGDLVELGAFGRVLPNPKVVGVEWENPRDVHEVRAVAAANATIAPESLRVEWWASVWPDNGTGGWMKLDDHWNGQWVRPGGSFNRDTQSGALVYRFPALTKSEWRKALETEQYPDKKPPEFRRTLKIRLVGAEGASVEGVQLQVYGRSRWREGRFDVEVLATQAGPFGGRLDVSNGDAQSLSVSPLSMVSPTVSGNGWSAAGHAGQSARVRMHLLYADADDRNSNDLTRVTVRLGDQPDAPGFSFVPQDVLAAGALRIPAVGALVVPAESPITLANDPGPADSFWRKSVRSRVADLPEVSREQAMASIPRLQPRRWVPLGVPCARQEIFVTPGGDWMLFPNSLWTEARDTQRIRFRGKEPLFALLDTGVQPVFKEDKPGAKRYLEAGHLPLVHVEWDQDGIHYHHQLAATILLGDISEDDKRRGDETVCLLTRLDITNPGAAPATARLHLRFADPTPIALTSEGVIEIQPADRSSIPEGLSAIRGIISAGKPSGGGAGGWRMQPGVAGQESKASPVLTWSAEMPPGEKRTIYFKAAYVDLLDAPELAALKAMSFDERIPHDLAYWKRRLADHAQFAVPEPELVNFYKANLWHNVITCDREPRTGLYNEGVGTYGYKVFANETIMIARSMDMRGEHQDAERYIEPLLHFQGAEELTGRFSTKDGAFHSAGAYTHGQYAMNHGFVLWGIADHYLFTRDRAYLERVAPKLIKGCDFLITQRQATMNTAPYSGRDRDAAEGQAVAPGRRSPTHGLSPASSLEDVIEFKYWLPTNAYFYLGLKHAAAALSDIQHPEAPRLTREAESYRRDIEKALREAVTQAAVVPLRDGTHVPYVPSRVHQWRHLTEGWIREALYCGIDLAVGEVVGPDDPVITWTLDDLEDNIFFSRESGYGIPDIDRNWLGLGGVTLQPCLMDLPRLYMVRGEHAASLRAFWNAYALLIYPDVQCFAEWARQFGRGGGPVYKTSDEARFCMWFRQFLVSEEGDTLWLCRGTPRAWLENGKTIQVDRAATYFGPVAVSVRSETAAGRILATVSLPTRNPPEQVRLRLRHPEGKRPVRVTVNNETLGSEQMIGEDIRLPPTASTPLELVAEYGS